MNAESALPLIQKLSTEMRAAKIERLERELAEAKACPGDDLAGPFVLALAIVAQIITIESAYVVPCPISDEKVWEGAADWHLAVFTADPLEADTHIEIRNRLWDRGSKSIAGRVELIGSTKTNPEPLARARADGLKLELAQ